MNQEKFKDLYNSQSIDIWIDNDDDIITLSLDRKLTLNFEREEFQNLYNAVFMAKQMLKEEEDLK